MRFDELAGRNVVVWGVGREGRAAKSELDRRGVAVSLVVTGNDVVPSDLADVTTTGAPAVTRLQSADVVIKSPGVPGTSEDLGRLRDLGIPVTSLTDLWLSDNASRVLAVTGTKGKSTTSALMHHLVRSTGTPASLVGNGGTPVTDGDRADAPVAIAEVSSYQAADVTVSPRLVVVTSLYPEHLPWHGGYEQYVADKLNLLAHGCEVVVLPDLHGELADRVRSAVGGRTRLVSPGSLGLATADSALSWEGVGGLTQEHLPLKGRHNVVNAALALAAVDIGLDLGAAARGGLLESLRTFVPLAHRLEVVPSADGRLWVDDSLATAPEAVVAALETFPSSRVTLILGGADRGVSLAPLADYLTTRSPDARVAVIAVGPVGARWVSAGAAPTTQSWLAPNFRAGLQRAKEDPESSDVVMLSPGAPSFDEFANFEERSRAFRLAASSPTRNEGVR